MKLFGDQHALVKLLRDGIEKGRWTLQDLDIPGRHTVECCQAAHYRNPLRDDPQPVQPVQTDPGYNPDAEFPF